ncbi:Homeobox-containing protein 1 [Trichinella spiralis]|uniref:Homeobox-containing protein 1 n=1 Tax=Trichinella spiralis TaxID=6334 RepID=A0A0V1BII0_TRISP|nr:Homeobox-containing protein 1 [Trichinella spiralis]
MYRQTHIHACILTHMLTFLHIVLTLKLYLHIHIENLLLLGAATALSVSLKETAMMSTPPLFSVEQVDLVRRIRQTGITIEQIVQRHRLTRLYCCMRISLFFKNGILFVLIYFEKKLLTNTLNRLDEELSSQTVSAVATQQYCGQEFSTGCGDLKNGSTPSPQSAPVVDQKSEAILAGLYPYSGLRSVLRKDHLALKSNTANGSSPYPRASNNERRHSVIELTTPEQKAELAELKKKDEEEIINEIREFVSRCQVRQQTIAQMTGISQPYVSKFLSGIAKELSERVRTLMFSWFILCRNRPELIAEMASDANSKVKINASKEFYLPRRERFVFKQAHIDVLERFFNEEPYPNMLKREEIASACNLALQSQHFGEEFAIVFCLLAWNFNPKDLVTEHIVANWFSNRRKEKRRKQFVVDSRAPRRRKSAFMDRISTDCEQHVFISDDTSVQHHCSSESNSENIAEQLAAVSSSVLALVNPYEQEEEEEDDEEDVANAHMSADEEKSTQGCLSASDSEINELFCSYFTVSFRVSLMFRLDD